MERIVIEVADATAKKWRLSSQQLRDEISQKIAISLAKDLEASSREDFKRFLDDVGERMKERGLTEEILQEILKEDE